MILLPLAELGDLDVFLRGGFSALDDTRVQEKIYVFDKEFPGMMPPNRALHAALLREMTEIVSALVWLHEGLRIPGSRDMYCAHMDLKPSNILITRDPSHNVGVGVGRWKISDFGISLFKKSTNEKALGVHSIRDVGPRLTSRAYQDKVDLGRGPYEPPEVSSVRVDGRECDVWSIGCVLSEVVEFALGGRQAVEEFRRRRFSKHRFQGADDYFYQTKPCIAIEPQSRDSTNTEVKSQVIEWFEERSSTSSHLWIEECMDLLKKQLVVDPSQRATAKATLKRLDNLLATSFPNEVEMTDSALDHGHQAAKTLVAKDQPEYHPLPERTQRPALALNSEDQHQRPMSAAMNSTPTSLEQGTSASDTSASSQSAANFITNLDTLPTLSLPSRAKAVDVAISPTGDHVALLHTDTVYIYRVDGNLDAIPAVPLASGTKWKKVCNTDHYVAVYGINKTKKEVSQIWDSCGSLFPSPLLAHNFLIVDICT